MYSFVLFNFLFNVDQHQSLRKKLTLSWSYYSYVCAIAFNVGQTSYVLMCFNKMKPLGSYFCCREYNSLWFNLDNRDVAIHRQWNETKALTETQAKHDKNEKDSQATKQFALICSFKLLCADNYIIALQVTNIQGDNYANWWYNLEEEKNWHINTEISIHCK